MYFTTEESGKKSSSTWVRTSSENLGQLNSKGSALHVWGRVQSPAKPYLAQCNAWSTTTGIISTKTNVWSLAKGNSMCVSITTKYAQAPQSNVQTPDIQTVATTAKERGGKVFTVQTLWQWLSKFYMCLPFGKVTPLLFSLRKFTSALLHCFY